MPILRKYVDEYAACIAWQDKVSAAAIPFEARWNEAALRRVDPALHARFRQQRELFNAAVEGGALREVADHGAAMVRAYVAVFGRMDAANVPDDAYQIGRGPKGLTIGIGPKPCCGRLLELYGDDVQWLTPDEVATIIELDARAKMLVEVKRKFPGAEIND